MDKVKLKIGRCQFNRDLFPAAYTADNKFGLYSPEEKAAAIAGAFNRESNIWLDFSPFSGGEKQEQEAVRVAGLAFAPKWHITFTPEKGGAVQSASVIGNGRDGVAISAIDGILGIGGESADESLGYHIRFHCSGEGTYHVRAELPLPGGRVLADEVEFRVS